MASATAPVKSERLNREHPPLPNPTDPSSRARGVFPIGRAMIQELTPSQLLTPARPRQRVCLGGPSWGARSKQKPTQTGRRGRLGAPYRFRDLTFQQPASGEQQARRQPRSPRTPILIHFQGSIWSPLNRQNQNHKSLYQTGSRS